MTLEIIYKKEKKENYNKYATEQILGHRRNQREKKTTTWQQIKMETQCSNIYEMQQKQL